MATIGESIRKFRSMRDWTQAQLADRSFMSRQQICNFEGDKMDPPALALVSISNALGVTPNDLLEGQIKVPRIPQEITQQVTGLLAKVDLPSMRLLIEIAEIIQNNISNETSE